MNPTVTMFEGPYEFLSNFHRCAITFDGVEYPSLEHAFQAAKTENKAEREDVRQAPGPGAAKRRGQKVTLRADWETIKIGVMKDLVRQKFTRHAGLKAELLKTENAELVEGNVWKDTFWGVCGGVGLNHLGRLLMEIREEIRCGDHHAND